MGGLLMGGDEYCRYSALGHFSAEAPGDQSFETGCQKQLARKQLARKQLTQVFPDASRRIDTKLHCKEFQWKKLQRRKGT